MNACFCACETCPSVSQTVGALPSTSSKACLSPVVMVFLWCSAKPVHITLHAWFAPLTHLLAGNLGFHRNAFGIWTCTRSGVMPAGQSLVTSIGMLDKIILGNSCFYPLLKFEHQHDHTCGSPSSLAVCIANICAAAICAGAEASSSEG